MIVNVWNLLAETAARTPERPALRRAGDAWTYAETRERALALAASLRDAGVARGDRVGCLMHNDREHLLAYFAFAAAGAVLVSLNTRLTAAEQRGILAHAGARWLVHDAAHAARAAELDVAPITPPDARLASFDVTLAADHQPAQLYYTSGTTGEPKGVVLTHANVTTHARTAIAELSLSERDTWAHIAPMFHLADAWATFAISAVGGAHVFLPQFAPRAALDLLCDERVTITNLVPTMLNLMVKEPGAAERSYALRTMLSGGAPIAPDVVRRILATFGCDYVQTYGMTETSPYLTISLLDGRQRDLPLEEQRRLRARTGRPFLGIELEVVDDAGAPVPRDDRSVGEIRVRGAHVSPGYWNRPEETAAAFRDGWLYTGDLAVVDAAGSVNIVDRRKDMILTGGENVYSIEVENALHEHPAVLEAAVFARPDAQWGERVCAAVVLRPGASASAGELVEHCRTLLAGYKCPRELELRAELPRTGSGKITKRALREEGARPGSAIAGAAPPPDGV